MTHRHLPSLIRPLRLPLIAGTACSLLLLSGCGGDEAAQEAIKDADRAFTSVALGDANAFKSNTAKVYNETEQSLSAHAGDSSGFAEAAAIGVAMAKRGQAALASQEASKAEGQALHHARIIRGMINEYLTNKAIAEGAGSFDPSADIADLNSIIELRRDDINDYQQRMDQINQEIAAHDAKIEDLRSKADQQRNEAGAIELRIPRVSAQEGAELAKQMREFSLRADQFDLEATRIEGIVGQLRPGAREVSLNVEKARSQIDLLEKAITELQDRAAASQQDASDANANANAALDRIKKAVSDYQALRDGEVESANNKAISLVRASLSALRDAKDAVKSVATLNKSDANQMLAEMQMRQAIGEREEAELYLSINDAKIPGNWVERINAATQRADELTSEAQQSYQAAASALRGAQARGDAAEKVNAAADRLDALGGVVAEPEPEYIEQDEDTESYNDSEEGDAEEMSSDSGEMTLEDILANTPEEMRETVRAQLQGLIDTLEATDDVDALYDMLDQIDAQSEAMSGMLPPEMQTEELLDQMNAGFDWVKRQIEARIEEIENG
ncbi:MAG: hypothetical protein R3B67_11600 [Phycisphaerales bacterium]